MIPNGYGLIWSDEFDSGISLDTTKWFVLGNICTPWSPEFLSANVSLDGISNLLMTATKDANGYYGGGVATRCDNTNTSKFDFKYGYVEIRAKLADTNQINGIGTSLWLTSSSRWPPEIDITETGSGPVDTDMHSINVLNMTRHCNTADGTSCTGTPGDPGDNMLEKTVFLHDTLGNPINLSKDFHRYGLEWTPTYVSWLFDDVEQFRITTGVPQENMYIILDIAPGNWGAGPVQPNTPFPTYVYIDYVRVYQKSGQTLGSIGISPTSTSVSIGNTVKLSASCKDQSGVMMTCPVLIWSSDNTSVVTVDSNGLVTGITAGSANIIASSGTVNSNISNITIAPVPTLSNIQLSLSIKIGTTKQLTVKCLDQNNNKITCPILIWSSDNRSVATVSSSGIVKGITGGLANITASASGITSNKFIITVTA